MKASVFPLFFAFLLVCNLRADDETAGHDAKVARQRTIITGALAKQQAENTEKIKDANDKARLQKELKEHLETAKKIMPSNATSTRSTAK